MKYERRQDSDLNERIVKTFKLFHVLLKTSLITRRILHRKLNWQSSVPYINQFLHVVMSIGINKKNKEQNWSLRNEEFVQREGGGKKCTDKRVQILEYV